MGLHFRPLVKCHPERMKQARPIYTCLLRSIERAAAHDAARKEQEARGLLDRQKLMNEKEAEQQRAKLFELQAEAAAIESTGQAKAEAQVGGHSGTEGEAQAQEQAEAIG